MVYLEICNCDVKLWIYVGSSLFAWLSVYFSIRIYLVGRFLGQQGVDMFQWDARHFPKIVEGTEKSAFYWYGNLIPSFRKLLFTPKRLKRKNFAPPEIIDKLNS